MIYGVKNTTTTIKVVMAFYQDGLNNNAVTFEFLVPSAEFDIIAAAKAAAKEYCQTEEGKQNYERNRNRFNWGDLYTYVPDEIMKKHGFCRVDRDIAEIVEASFDEQLVDETDITPLTIIKER